MMNANRSSTRWFHRNCELRGTFKGFRLAVYCLLATVPVKSAPGQTYAFSAPISGWSGVDLSFGAGSVGGMVATFGTLNETLYYDATAQTLRQIGSVSLSPSLGSFPIEGGTFSPSPLAGSASLTIGDGSGILPFDTGTQNIAGGSSDLFSWILSLPVSGFCTVINNGQTNSGAVSYSIDLSLVTTILSATPTNLTVAEFEVIGGIPASEVATIGGVSLFDGTDDNTYQYSWNLSSVTATPTPEPGFLVLFGFGASMLALLCRRRCQQQSI